MASNVPTANESITPADDAAARAIKQAEETSAEDKKAWSYEEDMEELHKHLSTEKIVDEHYKAEFMFKFIENIISHKYEWNTVRELVDKLMTLASHINSSYPHQTTPRNIIYRIRKLIFDEYHQVYGEMFFDYVNSQDTPVHTLNLRAYLPNLTQLLAIPEGYDSTGFEEKVQEGLKGAILEYQTEMDNMHDLIVSQGPALISEGDNILTLGYDPWLCDLFSEAATNCSFNLYVAETSPRGHGYLVQEDLAEDTNINFIMIPDQLVAKYMNKITKVILPCGAVLREGDVKTVCLGAPAGICASRCMKDVFVMAAPYQVSFEPFVNYCLSSEHFEVYSAGKVSFITDEFNLVDAKYITKIISNTSQLLPSQVRRVVDEIYSIGYPQSESSKIPPNRSGPFAGLLDKPNQ